MSSNPTLTSMTVSLPTGQKAYVKLRAARSGCSTPSEYVRRLIFADQIAQEREELELKILEGLNSPTREISNEDWSELRSTLRSKLAEQQSSD